MFILMTRLTSILSVCIVWAPGVVSPLRAQDEPTALLPDLVVIQDSLLDHDVIPAEGGRKLLRLSNTTANLGEGELRIVALEPEPDGTQRVVQTIEMSDGTTREHPAGRFVFHEEHGHVHVEDWALYRLREVLEDDGVGGIIAEGTKTSFCILDGVEAESPPRAARTFGSCGAEVQGLSVGWADLYEKDLPGQTVDATVPDGLYWLESIVDPNDLFVESNEDNNVERVLVEIGDPLELERDPYEPNDSVAEVESRPVGGLNRNSPNLGPVNPITRLTDLSFHAGGNADVFRFYTNSPGAENSRVRLDYSEGAVFAGFHVTLELLDSSGKVLEQADGAAAQTISLAGRPAGWYYVRVSSLEDTLGPDYDLTIRPPSNVGVAENDANEPPAITVHAPPKGDVAVKKGLENFLVEWSASDPEGDPLWVNVYMHTVRNLTPVRRERFLVDGGFRIPAEGGSLLINTAGVASGTYWISCEVTDGGTTVEASSDGTVTIREQLLRGDCDQDGDACSGVNDALTLLSWLFRGDTAPPCLAACDTDGNGEAELTDAVYGLDYCFTGTAPPPAPFPDCGLGTEADVTLGCATLPNDCN